MSKQADKQRNKAQRQFSGKRRRPKPYKTETIFGIGKDEEAKSFTVKNKGTRKQHVYKAFSPEAAIDCALADGLAKSIEKLVIVDE